MIEVVDRKNALILRVGMPIHRHTYVLTGNNLSEWEAYMSMLVSLTEESKQNYKEAASMLKWVNACRGEVAGVVEDGSALVFTITFDNPYDMSEFERGLAMNLE